MKKLIVLAVGAASLASAACSSMPALPSLPFLDMGFETTSAAASLPETTTVRRRVAFAIELLGNGNATDARSELKLALSKSPRDATALHLLEQIESDPATLLGAEGGTHVVVPGDTMSTLAERYLGDPMMFYALSRYNGLAKPNALSIGNKLRIPSPRDGTSTGLSGPPNAAVSGKLPATTRLVPAGDVEKANVIRLQALESLNTGDVARAVSLLKQAEAFNGADPAIQRDLQRALRLQAALADG